jgi:hypothetical protein
MAVMAFLPKRLPRLYPRCSGCQTRAADDAALVLMLDRHDHVTQVNLSCVVPGTTLARTVAWKPDDLRRQFSRMTR